MAELRQEGAGEGQDASGLFKERKQIFPLRGEEGILFQMIQQPGLEQKQEQKTEQSREEDVSVCFHRLFLDGFRCASPSSGRLEKTGVATAAAS